MIAADIVRALALVVLGVALLSGKLVTSAQGPALLAAVAAVEGCGATLFSGAAAGALRAVVPTEQLAAATATQSGRTAAVQIIGPPAGGALLAAGRALPFLADALSYIFSTLSLLAMRTPFQQSRERGDGPLRTQLLEGFRFLWGHPFLRATSLIFGVGNLLGPGLTLTVTAVAHRQGLSASVIGLLLGSFAAALLIGSLLSPIARRLLSVRGIVLLELWTATTCAAFLVYPRAWVLVAGMIPTALVIPATDSVVHGYRIAVTPDHLLGRSEAVRTTLSLLLAPLGPLGAGILLDATSPRITVTVFAAGSLALAVWGTLSPGVRDVG